MLAFVTNPGSDSVSIFDTATNTVVKKVSVGVDSTVGVAITPDGKIAYVSDRGARNVGVIDIATGVLVIYTATNKVVASVKVGDTPAGVAITPDGKRAYVANLGARSVSVVDTPSNTVLATVEVEPSPQQIAITPDGKSAYVTCSVDSSSSGNVIVIDTASNTVKARIQ